MNKKFIYVCLSLVSNSWSAGFTPPSGPSSNPITGNATLNSGIHLPFIVTTAIFDQNGAQPGGIPCQGQQGVPAPWPQATTQARNLDKMSNQGLFSLLSQKKSRIDHALLQTWLSVMQSRFYAFNAEPIFKVTNYSRTILTLATYIQQQDRGASAGLIHQFIQAWTIHAPIDEFGPQQLDNTVYAFAIMNQKISHLLNKSLQRCILQHIYDFSATQLANTLWAFSKLQEALDGSFFIAYEIGIDAQILNFSPQDCAKTLLAFARLARKPSTALLNNLQALILR
ncbi:MAG: hypothetical protein Q8K36_06110, partial [Alphaproteobacteria bacterium]|nr:hypothetical protein [Alphaproteobacteria bacterium]